MKKYKKYLSLFLCLVCFTTAVLIAYEKPFGGKGKGKNETVSDIDEFSEVISSVVVMMNADALSDEKTRSASREAEYDSVTFENSYTVEGVTSMEHQTVRAKMTGQENWCIDKGGDRLYVDGFCNMQAADSSYSANNTNMYMKYQLYYDKNFGWLVRFDTVRGDVFPPQILGKWISVESFDEYVEVSDLFDQFLVRSYSFFDTFDTYINEQRDSAFTKNGSLFTMQDEFFKNLVKGLYEQYPNCSGLGFSLGALNDVTGVLQVDLSDEERPFIDFSNDINCNVRIADEQGNFVNATYNEKCEQKIVITNIDNTEVSKLDLDEVVDFDDLM